MSIESTHFLVVTVEAGKISFSAVGRTWDEKLHDLFAVLLPGHPILYGEWRPRFAENGDDFDVEVVFFGLVDPRDAGMALPARRVSVDEAERILVEKLFHALIFSAEATARIFPFSSRRGRFLGHIDFLPGWVPPSSSY